MSEPTQAASDAPIRLIMAPRIDPDSWLNEERFAEFRRGYEYACNATRAIEPLSKLSPEETYWIWHILNHGIEFTAKQAEASEVAGDAS